MSNHNNCLSSKQQNITTEETVVWKSAVKPNKEGNVIAFPSHQEVTYQELSIQTEGTPVKLKIVSSGFNRKSISSTHMQLAA